MGLSPFELAVIGLVIVLLFGTRRLPELGTGIGKAISNFKKSYREGQAIDVTPHTHEHTHEHSKDRTEDKPSEKKSE